VKTITVLSQGDSRSSKTWSNIPYYLVNTLTEMGYKVNTVNIKGNRIASFFYDKIFCRVLRHSFFKDTSYCYDRTASFQRTIDRQMMDVVSKYPDTDLFISTSFSFNPAEYAAVPSVMLCDWTYEYLISHFKGRGPDFFEKKGIDFQDKVINRAEMVFSLFPDVADYMKAKYPDTSIYYLGNVINALPFETNTKAISLRRKSPHVVFIGLPKYIEGLRSLCQAIDSLRKEGFNIELDVIGMNEKDVDLECSKGINFHGYLEKSNKEQANIYTSLLENAFIFVNTTPQWAGFSSALEAMYYALPILTSKYNSFTETFGNEIDFGAYCINNSSVDIAKYILNVLNMSDEEYNELCSNSRKQAEPFTWSAYVQKLLDVTTEIR